MIEIWGEIRFLHNGDPDGALYHCEENEALFDVTVDANGNIKQIAPSVIDKDGNVLEEKSK